MAEEQQADRASALAVVDKISTKSWRVWAAKAVTTALLGGEKGAAVYAQAREHLDLIDARSAMNQQLYATAMQQVVEDPDEVERAKARLVGDALRKHLNVEATIAKAAPHLEAEPTLRITDQTDGLNEGGEPSEADTSSREDRAKTEATALDSDWAATWNDLAENASSEELRERLGRVLAGELTRPGTYSRATVRAISELEQEGLESLRSVARYRFGQVLHPPKGWYDQNRNLCEKLLESGLIRDSGLEMSIQLNCKLVANGVFASGIKGDNLGLIVNADSETSFSNSLIPLTKVGIAVSQLLMDSNERAVIDQIVGEWDKSHIKQILIGPYVVHGNGNGFGIKGGTLIYNAPQIGGISVPSPLPNHNGYRNSPQI